MKDTDQKKWPPPPPRPLKTKTYTLTLFVMLRTQGQVRERHHGGVGSTGVFIDDPVLLQAGLSGRVGRRVDFLGDHGLYVRLLDEEENLTLGVVSVAWVRMQQAIDGRGGMREEGVGPTQGKPT